MGAMADPAGAILVVHPDRKLQRFVQRVLGATGRRIIVVEKVGEARLAIRDVTPSLVVVGSELRRDPACQAVLERAFATGCLATIVLHHDGPPPPELFSCPGFAHLITAPLPELADELIVAAQKLLRDDVFGLEKYLAWGAVTGETEVASAEDRLRAMAMLADTVERLAVGRREAGGIALAADELILNAIHNAPVDAEGVRYLRDVPRHAAQELPPGARPRLRWGGDGRTFGVAVRDPFGSLAASDAVAYLAKSLAQRGQVRTDGEGAGIGLAMTYAAADRLVFGIDPGRATEIIALFDVRGGVAQAQRPLGSFHVFVRRGAAA